jgi:hypothetical protein
MPRMEILRNSAVRSLSVIASIAVIGCNQDQEPPTQVKPSQAASRSAGVRPAHIRVSEQSFGDLASRAPSSAGFYFDHNATLVLQVRDSTDFAAARGAVSSLVGDGAIGADTRWHGAIAVRQSKFTFYQLASWRDSVFEHILGQFRGVTSLDMNEELNRVVIGLDPLLQKNLRQQLLPNLMILGIDTNAVTFAVEPAMTLANAAARSTQLGGNSIQGHADTLVGGIAFEVGSVGSSKNATIGIILDYGGVRSALTNSHSTRNGFTPDGDTAQQPAVFTRSFGYESSDPSTHNCGTWPFNYSCRNSDAAIYTLFASDTSQKGLIARTTYYSHSSSGSTTWDTTRPYFVVTSTTSSPATGTTVYKVGQTSGWTYGTVTATCVDKTVNGYTLTVLCNTATDMYLLAGDSGAPVFTWDGVDAASLSGLVNGITGSANYFTPLSQIAGDLTSTISIARGINLSSPSISGSVSGTHPSISWGSVSNATAYELYRRWCIWDPNNLFSCSSSSNGWEYIGRLYLASYLDGDMTVSAYDGASQPAATTYGWAGYEVRAVSGTDVSDISNTVYFTLAP